MPANPTNGTTVSISNTPQAKDDVLAGTEDRLVTFDVMANDLGGNGKSLYSVDQSDPLHAALTATSRLGAAISIVNGKVVYDSAGAAAIQHLAAGQTATDTFQYVIQLGNGTLSVANVTVTVTGTNDGPLLSADPVASHALTEVAGATGSTLADTSSATLAFTDLDLNDTHTVSIGAPAATWSAGTVPAATLTALNGALTSTLHDSTGTGAGSAALNFAAPDKAFDFLAQGQTLTVTYNITLNDGQGGVATRPVTFVVTGTNDGPVLAADAGPHALTETAGAAGSATLQTASATLAFTDVDLTDSHTASVGAPAIVWSAGQPLPAGLSGALTGALTATVTDSTNSGSGSVTANFSAADKTFDFLGAGQTLTVTYNVSIDDGHGGVSTKPVSVVVTGSNDGPVLAADSGPHAIAEATLVTGSSAVDSASATLAFTDLDLTDTHTVSVASPAVVWSGGATLPAGLAATLASGLTTTLTEANGAGSLTATLQAADRTFDFLAQGETLTVTYDVTLSDGHGGSATRPVTFVVTGANDAVQIDPDASGPHTLTELANTTGSNIVQHSSASLTGTDPDLSDTHEVTFGAPTIVWSGGVVPAGVAAQLALAISEGDGVDSTGTGHGTALPNFNIPDKVLDFLAEGETLTVTYAVRVDDGHGSIGTTPVTFTILGTNDKPILVADASGPHAIAEAAGVTGSAALDSASATLQFFGVDAKDQHTVSASTQSIVWSGGSTLPDGLAATLASSLHTSLSQPGGAGSLTATLEAPDKTFDFLAQGETLTVTYNVTIDDGHGGTASRPVTFVVNGANDAVTLNPDASGPHVLTELANTTGSNAIRLSTATLTGSDADLGDEHAVTIGAPTVTWSGGVAPPGLVSQLAGALTEGDGADTTGTGQGTLVLNFAMPDKAFDILGAGETMTVTYNVTVDDGHGSTATQPVTFTVVGGNDLPNMNAQASLEHVVNGGFEQNNPALPGFAWSNAAGSGVEINPAGTYAVSGASGLVMEVDVNGGAPLDDVSQTIATVAGQTYSFAFDAAARSGFAGATNNFQVLWNGVVIDTVAPSSTAMAHHSYTVVADGASSKIEFREILSDGVGGIVDNVSVKDAIAERAGVTGSAAADTTSVNFTLVDLDLNDVHSATPSLTSVVWSGGSTLPAGLTTALGGALTTSMVDTTGHATGSLTATFSAPDATFDFLAQGESLAITYNVTVNDGHGGVVTRPVNVVIAGTNDAPQVTAAAATAVNVGSGVSSIDALAHASDVDHGASLSVVNVGGLPAGVTYNAASHAFSLDTSNAAYAGLPGGQTQTVTVTYGVSDGLATTAASSSWTLTGANHQPVLAAAPTTSGAISFYAAEGNVQDTIGTANGTSFGVGYATGHDGQAFNFTGSNYATIPNQIPANFTIEGWFKTSANSLGGTQFFQGNGLVYADVGGLQKDFGISILNNHLAFGTGGNFDSTIQSTSNVVTGDWVNFAAVRNGSVISLYVNGVLEASSDTTYAGLLNAPSVINLGANTIDSRYFTGELDGLSVYNRALSTAELQALAGERGTTLVEPAGVTGSSAALGTSVALKLTDVDTTDIHTTSISAPTLNWSGGAVPAGVASALANVASAAVTTDTAGSGAGAVTISFAAPQSTFDFLAGGQTLTATYTVSVADGHGGTASQPVTFTIIGTNDAAAISGTSTGAVQEDGVLTASGTLSVADVDSGEAHFLAPASLTGTYGAFTFNDGAWGYALNNGAANVQALATGQVVHDTLTVTSQDGTASRTIDVAITGKNEPVFTQLLANNSFEGGSFSSTQIPGWTNDGGTSLEIVGNGFNGIGGSDGHMLDTQATPGGITISQLVDVATGDHATLTIRVAAEMLSDGRHPGSSLVFTWDGVTVKTITESDFSSYNQLQTFTVDVVGQAGQDLMMIHDTGTGSVGYALDSVKLEAWIVT